MEKFFITGSSQGIGKSLADLLLQRENTNVTGISRTNNIQHERFRHLPLNLSDTQSLISMLDDVYSDIDKYDKLVLVNNAGYLGEIKFI
jgi:benzil reductase ((S)-benzoin forming)